MFKNLGNMASMLRQVQAMGGKLEEQKQRLRAEVISASAGGGMVEVEANGLGEIVSIRVEPSLVEKNEREMIEDLTVAAVNQALAKAKQLHLDTMQDMVSGIPGLQDAISSLGGGGPATG